MDFEKESCYRIDTNFSKLPWTIIKEISKTKAIQIFLLILNV